MSKNIEEIVEVVLPDNIHDTHRFILTCREQLKQALNEGKLVVPLSEEAIEQAMYSIPEEYMDDFCEEHIKDIAKAIYQAQFGGNK